MTFTEACLQALNLSRDGGGIDVHATILRPTATQPEPQINPQGYTVTDYDCYTNGAAVASFEDGVRKY